ncbi:hypothetical protein PP182_19910 [Maribacter sp. PR1]|uniref:NACHT domain-containing protein n=1 Tax=Maribacter cobaltidurans TaxID=1178778 RepID=A0ABU7IZD4_9FLAO|nr:MULTISPECIES: hypothetical protein [Maribacter]MDC6390962.1 hypothetical protein [Maribacter sp. PR1]MEE1978354.1 hypothetical protein [Maribacter cobaltidurans]
MFETKTIKILVSCPGDVDPEKEKIKRLCSDFTVANHGKSNIAFHVIDWKDYVGHYGDRGQEQLNNYFGTYDVYIGILWKRFGTPPGSINEEGKANQSGTEEEFRLAMNFWDRFRKPKIQFFVKDYDKQVNNSLQSEQIKKVFEFLEELKRQNSSFLNYFDSEDSFNSKMIQVLLDLQHEKYKEYLQIENENINKDALGLKISKLKNLGFEVPIGYISRKAAHFQSIKERKSNPFQKINKLSLEDLLKTNKRIILLGDAGSGKSTELRNLQIKLSEDSSPYIPIYQNLNMYTPEKGFEGFLPDFWRELPEELLVIIWDGLDEIPAQDFNKAIRQIENFSSMHEDVNIVLSSRTNFYELPLNDTHGTLRGFEPYMLTDLGISDATQYYSKKYSETKATDFINQVFEANLADLIAKPFFLMLLASLHHEKGSITINRRELYDMFLHTRIDLDAKHFKTTYDIRSKRNEIDLLLQRVALAMEMLCKNHIYEAEILTLITSEEFKSLKYCTAFKKKDGEENIWQFEHNNIQEFLAAKFLSKLDFKKVINLVTVSPDVNKVIPSWVNTLSFLFSTLDKEDPLFQSLLDWFLENEKEVLVKFEPDKIDEDLRIKIFQGIFNYSKEHDLWVSSNKFNDRELSRFGKSEENIHFLLNELADSDNKRIVKVNAIRLIGYNQIENGELRTLIKERLLEIIDQYSNDPDVIYNTIYALNRGGHSDSMVIEHLMKRVGKNSNQYIRASMYSILFSSELFNEFVDYIIEGYEILNQGAVDSERDDVSLADERWYLQGCVKKISKPGAIKKLTKLVSNNDKFIYGYDSAEVFEAIINNAAIAFSKDDSVFDTILSWYLQDVNKFRTEKSKIVVQFFILTGTRGRAFKKIWEKMKNGFNEGNVSLAAVSLMTNETIAFILEEHSKKEIDDDKLKSIYFELGWVNRDIQEDYRRQIEKETRIAIEIPKIPDYEGFRIKRLISDFNLLFDKGAFLNAVIEIFEGEQKEVLTHDDLFNLKKSNFKLIELDDTYSNVALWLLRDSVKGNGSITKERILSWFEEQENLDWYRISKMYEHIKNNEQLEPNPQQIEWIVNWCVNITPKIDFVNAITVEGNRTSFNQMAFMTFYFTKKFDILHTKKILLDMMSFDYFEDEAKSGIFFLTSKLEKEEVVERMILNLNNGINYSGVLKNHITYLTQHKVVKSYPLILKELLNPKMSEFTRVEFLNIYFNNTNDIIGLKSIIHEADANVRWEIIQILIDKGQKSYVINYLHKFLTKNTNEEETGKALEFLVWLNDLNGLKSYVDWIKRYDKKEIETSRAISLKNLRTIDTLPYLMELLEFSYKNDIVVDKFQTLNSFLLDSLQNIALISNSNFKAVKESLIIFKEQNMHISEKVKYLIPFVERMEEQFYRNITESLTVEQVEKKLNQLLV